MWVIGILLENYHFSSPVDADSFFARKGKTTSAAKPSASREPTMAYQRNLLRGHSGAEPLSGLV
jgi:hypothetical protein